MFSLKKIPYPSRPSNGFVLVTVLLFVALATILVVVASMMAQVERKAAANTARLDLARANAVFALDAALNQVQCEAGPDQRVTARAEILDGDPATLSLEDVAQPYWTGVWKTGAAGLDVVNAGTPQRQVTFGSPSPSASQKSSSAVWLVSGTAPHDPLAFAGVTTGTMPDAVALARNIGGTGGNVIAPLVAMKSGTSTTGGYAYWVSDEGLKARINQRDSTLGVNAATDAARSQAHVLAVQAAAGSKASALLQGNDLRADADVTKAPTLASLANLTGLSGVGGSNVAVLLPDFTMVSRGVLADVRRGGLKKDLTAAFESPVAFSTLAATYGNGAEMLYRSASPAGLTIPAVDTGITPPMDGILWFNLYAHYNAYKGTMASPVAVSGSPSPAAPAGAGSAASLPQTQSQRVYSLLSGGATTKLNGLVPIPVAYRVDIALSSYQSGGQWKLRLHYYPQLVVWNPYACRLTLSTYQLRRDVGAFATAGSGVTLTLKIGAATVPAFSLNPISTGRLTLQTKPGDCATLEPGETRVFALDQDAAKSSVSEAITFADLVSNPSMSADFSQYCDVPGFGGAASGGDAVTAVLSDRRLRCQNVDTFILPVSLKWPRNDGTPSSSSATRYLGGGAWDIAAAGTPWDNTLQIQQLNAAPRRIIGFYIRQKGLRPSAGASIYSNAANAVPLFMGNAGSLSPVDDSFSYAWQEVYLSPLGTLYQNGQTDVQIVPSGGGGRWETSLGAESAGAGSFSSRVVLRDVPNQPMVSLGQFMHMPAANFLSIGVYQVLVPGSMFVGGSCASPIIATDKTALSVALGTAGGGVPNSKLFLDDSFLANEALFDRFYFSTIPPQNLNAAGTTYPAPWTEFNAANPGPLLADMDSPVLNSRMKPYFRRGVAPSMADLRDVEKAAANLLLDGAFNVNSTSVPAWKAFLGGLSGTDLRVWNATAGSAVTVTPGTGTPVFRFWSASGLTGPNEAWSGLRVLSDTELDQLATRIVEQVKLRGPFLSLADFLNRRLGTASLLTRCGALQAAIDTTSPDINSAAKAAGVPVSATSPAEAGRAPDLIAANMTDAAGNPWNTAVGMPGYLMQQDLVQALSPAMAARSDTFTIRTYGEARNPRTGAIEGRAWAEAVVQRLPDWVDDSQAPETPPVSLNASNQSLGRRFQVVAFRWLNENEI